MIRKTKNKNSRALNVARVFFFFCVVIFALPSLAFGIDLARYREKLSDATDSLATVLYTDEKATADENAEFDANTIAKIRASFSSINKLEFAGQTIEPDHKWLFEKLDALEKSLRDPKKRIELTNEILDRLYALDARISELEKANSAGSTKDQNKRKLDEILSRPEFAKAPTEKSESLLERIWRRIREWLASILPTPKPMSPSMEGLGSISYVLQILIYVIVIGLIGFLLYRFLPGLIRRFRKREKDSEGVRIILGEKLSVDDSSQSLFADAESLAREGNLRAAIRKGYIACLCELSDRRVLRLSRHKTNRDYLRDVRKREALHQDLNKLTQSFERHWYGAAETSETDWLGFRENYSRTVSALKSRQN